MSIEKGAKWWNNGESNRRSVDCPGEGWSSGRLYFKRISPSEETRKKMSVSLKGKLSWNKGLKNPYSEETIAKMSESAKARAARGILPDNTGRVSWNKGLTADTDERVMKYANAQRGQVREGNYLSGANNPNWNDEYTQTAFDKYAYKVRRLTEATYEKNKDTINPNGHPRARAGVEGGYQLDHIVSVKHGFDNGIPPEEIASIENLQMLTWEDNRAKGYNE